MTPYKIQTATPFLLRPFVWVMMLFLYIPTVLKNFGKTFYDEIYESNTKFPQLFIYSTGDEIIDYKGMLRTVWISRLIKTDATCSNSQTSNSPGPTLNSDVDDMVEQRRKINEVFVQKFDSNSPHVAHLRHNQEKYIEVLKCFLFTVMVKKWLFLSLHPLITVINSCKMKARQLKQSKVMLWSVEP